MGHDFRVSFVIATANSARTLESCLESITRQDYPIEEVIIVDGFSRDGTVEIARRHHAKVISSAASLSECRQIGVRASVGDITACFDSDIILPHREWLSRAVARFHAEVNLGSVWPVQIPPPHASAFQRAYLMEQWEILARRIHRGVGWVGGSNGLFLKSSLDAVGGLSGATLHDFEDFYLARRLLAHGFKVELWRDPIIHDTNISIREFFRKQHRRTHFLRQRRNTEILGLSSTEIFLEYGLYPVRIAVLGLVRDKDPASMIVLVLALTRGLVFLTPSWALLSKRPAICEPQAGLIKP